MDTGTNELISEGQYPEAIFLFGVFSQADRWDVKFVIFDSFNFLFCSFNKITSSSFFLFFIYITHYIIYVDIFFLRLLVYVIESLRFVGDWFGFFC